MNKLFVKTATVRSNGLVIKGTKKLFANGSYQLLQGDDLKADGSYGAVAGTLKGLNGGVRALQRVAFAIGDSSTKNHSLVASYSRAEILCISSLMAGEKTVREIARETETRMNAVKKAISALVKHKHVQGVGIDSRDEAVYGLTMEGKMASDMLRKDELFWQIRRQNSILKRFEPEEITILVELSKGPKSAEQMIDESSSSGIAIHFALSKLRVHGIIIKRRNDTMEHTGEYVFTATGSRLIENLKKEPAFMDLVGPEY